MNKIRALRIKAGLSQDDLAGLLGVHKTTISKLENGDRRLTVDWMVRLAGPLGVDPKDLLADEPAPRPPFPDLSPRSNAYRAPDEFVPPLRGGLPNDVPVLSVAAANGYGDGSFRLQDDPVDYVRRPPGLAHARDVYAIFVSGESMYPAFREGDLLYVSRMRPPAIGDDVIIHLHGKHNGDPDEFLIKRLEKRTATHVLARQFNPDILLEFPRERVKEIHKVLVIRDLWGV